MHLVLIPSTCHVLSYQPKTQHTVIAPIILAEIICCHHRVLSIRTHLITIATFITIYIIWLLFLGNYLTIWAYPLFERLTWWQTGLFLVGACACAMALYRLGLFIISVTWTESRVQQFYKSHMDSYALSSWIFIYYWPTIITGHPDNYQ